MNVVMRQCCAPHPQQFLILVDIPNELRKCPRTCCVFNCLVYNSLAFALLAHVLRPFEGCDGQLWLTRLLRVFDESRKDAICIRVTASETPCIGSGPQCT